MPIQHAVLSLLTHGPSYGYQLKATFEESIGPQWGPLNIGHLYQTLDRLERDGFVTSERQPGDVRPDRRMYTMTSGGHTELDAWLDHPVQRTGGYRDELFFKLLAASRSGGQAVRQVVDHQRTHGLGQLRALTELAETHTSQPLVTLLIDAARLRTESELKWLELVEQRADDLSTEFGTTLPGGSAGAIDSSADALPVRTRQGRRDRSPTHSGAEPEETRREDDRRAQ